MILHVGVLSQRAVRSGGGLLRAHHVTVRSKFVFEGVVLWAHGALKLLFATHKPFRVGGWFRLGRMVGIAPKGCVKLRPRHPLHTECRHYCGSPRALVRRVGVDVVLVLVCASASFVFVSTRCCLFGMLTLILVLRIDVDAALCHVRLAPLQCGLYSFVAFRWERGIVLVPGHA